MPVLLAGCGSWIIQQETPTPSPAPSIAAFDEERTVLAEHFGLDERAIVQTADGLVFAVEADDELHLLLSRAGNTEEIDILARVERLEISDDSSGGSSHVVSCPEGALAVRWYLFGQDTRQVTKALVGLDALGGEVVDGLWVMPILDEEIEPDQRWEIRDGLGLAPMASGTGAMFLSDGSDEVGTSTLCQSVH